MKSELNLKKKMIYNPFAFGSQRESILQNKKINNKVKRKYIL